MRLKLLLLSTLFGASLFAQANAQSIIIEVENLQPADGFYVTPVWFGFHDGNFDTFEMGTVASAGLELLAEEGDPATLRSEFAAAAGTGVDGVIFGTNGFGSMMGQPPVLDPGEVAQALADPNPASRFLNFATMIIPSNDAFIGNNNPLAIEVFDAAGNFVGPQTFVFNGASIYDSGTEVNDGQGAPFSTNGGTSSDEGGTVQFHAGLDNFLGTGTAAGTTINSIPGDNTPVFRITISQVPEPTSLGLMGLLGGCLLGVRRRRKATR